ncbi:hypothetical protein ME763_20550 [Streptomyces murinus]|uniref:DUF6414 family protein n=1 Tax=Streptomyces murinus TaxID=33900 RepID=UPI00117CD242|nr:hypothetical protein [Streptomyces murinus]WDO07853.1 hypothetical protein ME763_20550 [Streptomyces murinus]
MILREFLYVDTDKVRALLAQLDGGIVEESRETERAERRTTIGPRSAAQHLQGTGSESYTNKSLGDALFPTLEDALESELLLHDISEEASEVGLWERGELKAKYPPGSLVRITAPGSLFDTRYAASAFAAFGHVNVGLQGIGASPSNETQRPVKGKQSQRHARPVKRDDGGAGELEDAIPDFPAIDGTDGNTLRSFVRIAKGVFTPGLHINLAPAKGALVSARLQEGRQYLDTEAEILFARYGTERHEWTLVGSIGSYGTEETELPDMDFYNPNGSINRGEFAEAMNAQMRNLGRIGFIDLPQHPGFSIIPFAVYRAIPRSAKLVQARR